MLLGLNLVGHGVCVLGCLLGFAIHQLVWKLPTTEGEATREDPVTGARLPRLATVTGGEAELASATETQAAV